MNSLQIELDRLYGLGANTVDTANSAEGDAPGIGQPKRPPGVRALMLEVALPAGWDQLSSVWKGVQSDLGFPPPAIAVSGVDGLQLWFSLASPISPSAGQSFLQGLCTRYLPDLASTQVRRVAQASEFPAAPPVEIGPERWSAFVAADLAAVFADTPWLDFPPNREGQATLLRALEPIRQAAFEAASNRLGPTGGDTSGAAAASTPPAPAEGQRYAQGDADAQRFLRGVMNDETAALALRIEAAKALLPYARRS